jgi:hypothetical protein
MTGQEISSRAARLALSPATAGLTPERDRLLDVFDRFVAERNVERLRLVNARANERPNWAVPV